MEEKAYTQRQVEYMLKLEYNRGVKDGEKKERDSLLGFLEQKKGATPNTSRKSG